MNAKPNTCSECGEPGATKRTIRLGDDDMTVTAHETCAAAIVRRHDEWLNSPEGRIALAERAGQRHCGRCGTTDDGTGNIQRWTVTSAAGVDEGDTCIPCATQIERDHPEAIIRVKLTDEQLATLKQWGIEGIGAN